MGKVTEFPFRRLPFGPLELRRLTSFFSLGDGTRISLAGSIILFILFILLYFSLGKWISLVGAHIPILKDRCSGTCETRGGGPEGCVVLQSHLTLGGK